MSTVSLNVYLAGPEVFLVNAREIGERKKELCEKYGFQGHFPLDGEEPNAPAPSWDEIYDKCVKMMDICDLAV